MISTHLQKINKIVAGLTLSALALGSIGFAVPAAYAAEGDVTVSIAKYIDGVLATAMTAGSADFPMSATWNASNIGAGSGSYQLGPSNSIPYEAMTTNMSSGADYSTSEMFDGLVVGMSCTEGRPFSFLGYTTGATLAEAQAGTPSMTPPVFTNLMSNRYVIVWNHNCSMPVEPGTVQVTIDKYIDGYPATASSAGGETFPMDASWNDPEGIGSGSGSYMLSSTTDPAYRAQTIEMQSGADYSTNENTAGMSVGPSCASGAPYALVGYTTGNTQSEAYSGTLSTSSPSFTNITHDTYVIVWNESCVPTPELLSPTNGSSTTTEGMTSMHWMGVTNSAGDITYMVETSLSSTTDPDGSFALPATTTGPTSATSTNANGLPDGTYYWHVQATDGNGNMSEWSTIWMFTIYNEPVTSTSTVRVTIKKFIDGHQATATSTGGHPFPMDATWDDEGGIGSGSGSYTLSTTGHNGNPTPYQAITSDMLPGADYSTHEVFNGTVVGPACVASSTPHFALVGYTSGNSHAEALAGTPTTTMPSFTNIQHDTYVIVWNHLCASSIGEIGGVVATSTSHGVLAVTSIEGVKTSATANGTFADGWKYVFNITVPDNETNLAMKFANWMSTVGSTTIPAANNMRISSAQADNGGATILITAADTYSTPALHMTSDLATSTVGLQVKVIVEVAIPSGTTNGAYTTNYGVQSL